MRRPPQMRIQYRPSLIINHSSPGGVLREGVFHKCSNIYAPPENCPRSGDAKHILPLMVDAAAFGHAYVISCMIVFMSTLQSNYTFSYLSPTIQLEKNIYQVINYNFIKTIKSEPTFGRSSIGNKSSLSNKKEHFTIYQL